MVKCNQDRSRMTLGYRDSAVWLEDSCDPWFDCK